MKALVCKLIFSIFKFNTSISATVFASEYQASLEAMSTSLEAADITSKITMINIWAQFEVTFHQNENITKHFSWPLGVT